jgi:hypothetical protein
LLIIPVVFTYVDDIAQWVARLLHRPGRGGVQPSTHEA